MSADLIAYLQTCMHACIHTHIYTYLALTCTLDLKPSLHIPEVSLGGRRLLRTLQRPEFPKYKEWTTPVSPHGACSLGSKGLFQYMVYSTYTV